MVISLIHSTKPNCVELEMINGPHSRKNVFNSFCENTKLIKLADRRFGDNMNRLKPCCSSSDSDIKVTSDYTTNLNLRQCFIISRSEFRVAYCN